MLIGYNLLHVITLRHTFVKGSETKFNLSSPPVACRHCLLGEKISCQIGQVFVVLKRTGMFVIYVDNIVFDDQSTPPTSKRRFCWSLTFYTKLIAVCIIASCAVVIA